MKGIVFDSVGKDFGDGENCGYQHFLLPPMFLIFFFRRVIKKVQIQSVLQLTYKIWLKRCSCAKERKCKLYRCVFRSSNLQDV